MNIGYQLEDENIVDYSLWRLPGIDIDLRGPVPELESDGYIVTIGAAQTFGRFVSEPYPEIISKRIGLPALNLGVSGAGPSFFVQRPKLLSIINNAKLAIVQVMSGRSSSNSLIEVQENQGIVKRVNAAADVKGVFAETAYLELLAELSPVELSELRAEIRFRALMEMQDLLRRITIPRVVFWFSDRDLDYSENLRDLSGYWGGYPHFLNGQWLEAISPCAEATVKLVCSDGLPQPLFDRLTGEPVKIWPEDKFPSIKFRCHNRYYPSPEMHAAAAAALEKSVFSLLADRLS